MGELFLTRADATFLTMDEVKRLTGIRRKGKDGSMFERQAEWLKVNRIPHWVNAAHEPIVPRAAIEGREQRKEPVPRPRWQPSPEHAGAH